MMKHMLILTGGIIFLAGLSGCATFNDSSSSASEQEDMNILREDLTRMQGRVETVELDNRRVASEVDKLHTDSSDTRNQAAVQERLDILERRMQAMDAAREKDKQAIVDQLSAKIAEIMSKGSSRPTRSAVSPVHSAPAAAGVAAPGASGGEHIVKAGETLSAIAATYKVKASAIVEANDLKDPDNLRAGQKLVIPK